MLLASTSRSPPKIQVGRTIEYGTPACASAYSTSALPRKYGSGDSIEGLVMLTCTTRARPARLAAWNSIREFSIAFAKLVRPWSKRTQKVL